jgi:histidinol-phosphate aminotransferase
VSIFKNHIAAMAAYKPPLSGRDASQFVLLDFNERTIPVSDSIKHALVDFINSDRLQQYPNYGDITEQLATYCEVNADQVVITNGSDHGIELTIRGTCREGDEVIIPEPTFAIYGQVAKTEALVIHAPQYTKAGGYPLQEVLSLVNKKTRLIVAANPNNPCGTSISTDEIETLATSAPHAAILVDECYFEYSELTAQALISKFENIVITRTFSKTWGIPSLRFGYILTANTNVEALLAMRGPYDINQMAVVAAGAALKNPEYTQHYVQEIMKESKPRFERFLTEKNIEFWPSTANYLLVLFDDCDTVKNALFEAGILVRPRKDNTGRDGLRVTIGTQAQTETLISVLEKTLSN